MKLTLKAPYDTPDMTFDGKRYVLTLEYAKKNFPPNFKDDETLILRLKANSRKVYDYIHYRCHSKNRRIVDTLINKTEEGRAFIQEVLHAQMEADIKTGYNDLTSAPAVNLSNGQIIDREELFRNAISVETEQLLEGSAGIFGVDLLSRAPYPVALRWLI